jgi:hypothetical protein
MSGLLKKIFGGGDDAASAAKEAGLDSSAVLDQVSGLFGGAIPDVGQVQQAVDGLSEPQLQGAATEAMQQLDGSTRTDFGQLLQGFLGQSGGAQAPAGVATGDPGALGQSLSGLLKSQGVGVLGSLFGGGSSAAGASGGSGAGGFDIASLLSNPMAKSVLAALIPSIMKAFQGSS